MGIFSRKNATATAVATLPVGPDLAALTGEYTIDPAHSSIGFTVRHAMVTNVRGTFGEHQGTLRLDGADPSASTPPSMSRSPRSTPASPTATATSGAATSSMSSGSR